MKLIDIIWYSWKGVKEIGIRAIITIIGIILAISFLIFAISVGLGFKQLLIKTLSSFLGANYIYVVSKHQILTLGDIYSLKAIPHVVNVVPIISTTGYLLIEGQRRGVHIVGLDPIYVKDVISKDAVIMGKRQISSSLALVGHFIAFDRASGKYIIKNGSYITIRVFGKTLTFRVSGILDPHSGIGPVWFGGSIVVPYYTLLNLLPTSKRGYTLAILIVDKPEHVDYVIKTINEELPHLRATCFKEALAQVLTFTNQVTLFLAFISSAATIIVALWMYDTVTISVLQRIREIGILKAIGFRNRDILV